MMADPGEELKKIKPGRKAKRTNYYLQEEIIHDCQKKKTVGDLCIVDVKIKQIQEFNYLGSVVRHLTEMKKMMLSDKGVVLSMNDRIAWIEYVRNVEVLRITESRRSVLITVRKRQMKFLYYTQRKRGL